MLVCYQAYIYFFLQSCCVSYTALLQIPRRVSVAVPVQQNACDGERVEVR